MPEEIVETKTPAQGAGAETTEKVVSPSMEDFNTAFKAALDTLNESNQAVIVSNEALIASNEAVLASNTEVVEAVKEFKEGASDFIRELVNSAKPGLLAPAETSAPAPVKLKAINPNSKYVVSQGKAFQDSDNSNLKYTEGDNVTSFDNERLQRLLALELIEEVKQAK